MREALEAGHHVWGISRSKEPDKVFLPYLWENKNYLERNPDFSREELMKILDDLCKEKKVKLIKGAKGEDYQWQRIYPSKSSWWQFWK